MAKPTPPRKDFTPTMDSKAYTHGQFDLDSNTGKMTPSILSQLENLPDELLELTIDFIADENDEDRLRNLRKTQKTLRSLCLTSKSLYRIALPRLYRVYMHKHMTREDSHDHNNAHVHSHRKLNAFLRSVTDAPWLAACIRELHLSQNSFMSYTRPSTFENRPEILRLIAPLLDDPALHADILAALYKGERNAKSAALLVASPRLEKFTISLEEYEPNRYRSCTEDTLCDRHSLENVVRFAATQKKSENSVLGRLKSMHIQNSAWFQDSDAQSTWRNHLSKQMASLIQSVFQLPTMRELAVDTASMYIDFSDNETQLEDRTSSIEDLRICASDVDTAPIANMIRWCKSLRYLYVRWDAAWNEDYADYKEDCYDPVHVFTSLGYQKKTLTSLTLNRMAIFLCSKFKLQNLATFENLELLALDEDFFLWDCQISQQSVSTSIWPPKLKFLTFFSGYDEPDPHLETLARILQTTPPNSLETFSSVLFAPSTLTTEAFDLLKRYRSHLFDVDMTLTKTKRCQVTVTTKNVTRLTERTINRVPSEDKPCSCSRHHGVSILGGLTSPVVSLIRDIGIMAEVEKLYSGFLEPDSRTQECPLGFCYDDDND